MASISTPNNPTKQSTCAPSPIKNWVIVSFDEVIVPKARIGWQGLKTDEYLRQGYGYLISGSDFFDGSIDLDHIWHVSKSRYEMDSNIQVTNGDVLVTKDGTIGKVAIVQNIDKPATLNSGVFVFKTKAGLNSGFLFRLLQSSIFTSFIRELSAGSTIKHLYQKDLKRLAFEMPADIKEQKAIAETLSDLDSVISSLDSLIKKKEDIFIGAISDLTSGRKRIKGFSKRWRSVSLKNCVEIYQGGTPSTSISRFWDGDIIWATPGEITKLDGLFFGDSERHITNAGLENSSACLVPEGTILLCTRATIGDLAIALHPMATNQGFKNLVCKQSVNNVFLAYLLTTLKETMKSRATGTTFLEISKGELEGLEFQIPEFDEQEAIANCLLELSNEITTLELERDKWVQIREGAMEDLLTGRVRLKLGDEECQA